MRSRLLFIGILVVVVVVATFFIFSTAPGRDANSNPSQPTANPSEKLTGSAIEGQLLFTRGDNLWAWRGDSALRMAIEPGNSIVGGKARLTQPAISPGANAIAYIRQDESFSDLWIVNADGSNPRQLTNSRASAQIRSQKFVDDSLWAFSPAWSPDGNILAYLSDRGTDDLVLWVWSLRSSTSARVNMLGAGAGGVSRPSWSSDGSRLVVAAYENGKPQIFRVNVQNGQFLKLTSLPDGAYDPAWSPDGKYIVYVARKGNTSELWMMTSEGEKPIQISTLPARTPVWSPKGDKVAFLGLKDGLFDIYTIDITNGVSANQKQISNKANIDGNGGLSWGK
jgi:TolB protein